MDLAPGQQKAQALRDGGFSDEEIGQWKGQTAQDLMTGGFSASEVKDYFGQKDPDMSATKNLVKQNVQAAQSTDQGQKAKREPIDPTARPVEAKDLIDAMAAGWGSSFSGLMTGGNTSPIALSKDSSYAQTAVSGASGLLGDAPAMAAGFVAGGAAGTALAGPAGAPIGAAAGAFAVPQAMRKILIDHYQKGDIEDAGDFARRAVDATWEGTKGAIVGATTALSGGLAGAVAGTAGRMAAEVAAQTTVSSALEGHLPDKRDFVNGAIAIGGLHAIGAGVGKAGYITDKLMNIYAETGAKPSEVIEAASNDPAVKGELLSQNPELPKEATPPEVPKEEPAVAPKEPPAEPVTPDEQTAKEAGDRILSRIGERAESEEQSLASKMKDEFWSQYANKLDYTKVIGDVIDEIGDQPLDEKNARVLMRLHAAVQDKIQENLEVGTRDFDTGKINGEAVLKPIEDYKAATGDTNLDEFKKYGIAIRSLELAKRGLEQPGSRVDDQTYVDAHPEIKPYFDRLVAAKDRVLDQLGASGRYSEDSIQAMKDLNQQHFSFKKILEPDPLTGKTPGTTKEIKKIGSSDLKFEDPILSTLRDVGNMIKMAHETEATNTFIDNMSKAEDPSGFYRVSEEQSGIASKTQIAGYEDGQRTLYDVPEEVADSIKRMSGNKPAMSVWTSLLKPFAAALRIGTVDNPLFAIRHAWRNQLTAPTLTQTGLKPFEALLYAPEYLSKGDSYHDFIYDGGGVNSIVPLGQGYLDGKIYELDKQAPFIDKAWNKVKTVAEFSHWAIVMNDNIVRFAEYKKMLGSGASRTESAFAAREVLPDFQKQGLQRSALQSITAFLNVHLQSMSRMVQETSDNPYGYIAKNLAYITTPSILLSAAQAGDDAIKDLPDWQKYMYWPIHISNWRPANTLAEYSSVESAYPSNARTLPDGTKQVNDGNIVRIQKPFTNGILFGSAIQAALEAWNKKDPKAFGDFAKTVAGSTLAEPVPTALNPVLEHMVNRNFYTGTPIVRQSMENKLPEMQYDQYTSETAKALGRLVSYVPGVRDIGPQDARMASPSVIDNYIHSWGGTLGYYAVDALDKGLKASGMSPDVVKPTNTLADIPFVKEFMIRFPNAKPQSVMDFEERYKKADEVTNSIKTLMKQGDVTGAVKMQDRYAINMDRLNGVDKALQNMNASIQKVNQSSNIDATQKRQLIDSMMFQMTSMAKEGNRLMDAFEKRAKN